MNKEKLNKHQVEQICKKLNENLIRFSFLAKGNHNSNYLLETTKNKYAIRVEDNQQFKNLKKEFEFLKIAKSGLWPKVIFFDASHKIISNNYFVEEFIEGKHPSENNPTNDFIVQMARWFKKLHQTTKKSLKPRLLTTEVRPYYKNYLKYRDNIKDQKLQEKLNHYILKALSAS
jgi:aminoglycoside phosphotransferase (APT) family kinase protein